ncbi:hypothetical protein NC652_029131 [Populus alba x Populus x berolinensis]|nr:hypothetical protein NC652_029131 [Populus alba x Populus x berolinensis]
MQWFGGYVGNWFNGYFGVGRAMAELRWAVLDQFCFQWEKEVNRKLWLMEIAGKLKPLEDCTATPNPDCGCSRGLNHLFCSYCYGNGSNHLIFVTRIKEVYFGS